MISGCVRKLCLGILISEGLSTRVFVESFSLDRLIRHGPLGAPAPDAIDFDCGLPVLGICHGFHRLVLADGGEVRYLGHRECGRAPVNVLSDELLFDGLPREFMSWLSHGDGVTGLGDEYVPIWLSGNGAVAATRSRNRRFWGIQFHPEVSHCEHGLRLLENGLNMWPSQAYSHQLGFPMLTNYFEFLYRKVPDTAPNCMPQ